MKSLDPDDQSMLLKTFNEVGLKYWMMMLILIWFYVNIMLYDMI